MRPLLLAALVAGCAGSSPPPQLGDVPDDMRACPASVLVPTRLSGVVTVSHLKAQEALEAEALRKSELRGESCAATLARLNTWIDDQRRALRAQPGE